MPSSCPYLTYLGQAPFCKRLACVCRCFSCKVRDKCDEFLECKNRPFKIIADGDSYFYGGARKLTNIIRSRKEIIPRDEFYSGLLHFRESSLMRALSDLPGEIIAAQIANLYFCLRHFPTDIEPKLSPRMEKLLSWLTYRHYLDSVAKRVKNGDMRIFATEEGKEKLVRIRDSPTQVAAERTDILTAAEDPMVRFSDQMVPVINWCIVNKLPPTFDDLVFSRLLPSSDIGAIHTADLDIGFGSFDELMLTMLRHVYRRLPEIKKTVIKYSVQQLSKLMLISILQQDLPLHMQAARRLEKGDWYLNYPLPDEIVPWPVTFGDKSLWASCALIGLIAHRSGDVQTDPLRSGFSFEQRLRANLVDRGFTILAKDEITPVGEIDFICRKENVAYVIEAKDYGLWYQGWYASSRYFSSRRSSLESSFSRIPEKIRWLDSNRESYGLTSEHKIKATVITGFRENVDLPKEISAVTSSELDSLFGNSKYGTYHDASYRFAKRLEGVMEKEWAKAYHGIFQPKVCPSHPACVYLTFEKDKANGRMLREFCHSLQNSMGGGPCPVHRGLCMWLRLCLAGIDPCPYASSFELPIKFSEHD